MANFYHFTPIDTLISMLTDSLKVDKKTNQQYIEFWATEITALNDTTERDLFVNVLINKVRQYATEQQNRLTEDQERDLGKLCYSDMYVISLTSKDLSLSDELNMWRGYGGNGCGVCLELDFSKIPPFYHTNTNIYQLEDSYILRECEYVKPEEIKIEQNLVKQIYESLNLTEKEKIKCTLIKASIMSHIANLSPYYKHEAYKSEHEWRFVKHSLKEPKYRKRGNLLIPYITYCIPITAISSITIGPCLKDSDTIKSLTQFIERKLGPKFDIKFSNIPYRG
ncbi:MAG: DUF2971 domain-containing protein [Bacteroidales bacterium]|nr:DUF2971 domain-containing protein [Bacteroidales bacterium]